MSQTTSDPLVGATMAHYEILAKLGGGGMGVVYAARDHKLGRRVALKFLPPQWSHDESAKLRFIREAQAASATDHPNICTIHDIDTAPDGRLFIVMAQYDGPTLKERLEQGPLRTDEAIDVAAQIAEGLARAHGQGVVHRDVKPGNLILTEDGVRIVDFGLARFAGSLQLTLEGSTLGTVAYMSPEQSRGDDADTRSDVWSIGVVLFEMLSGELPFKGGYAEMIANEIRTRPTPPLTARVGEHLEPVERVVRRALEKDPAQRYQNAREIARDLRLLQGRTLPLDLRTEALPPVPVRPVVRRRRFQAAIGVVIATLVAVGAVIVWAVVSPPDRIPIAIAPVVNQTGYAELDPYRLALTQELTAELSDSPVVRVLGYDRLLSLIRRFRSGDQDVSSREALQVLATNSGAQVIVVPTLLYENGGWRARAELRNAATATSDAVVETAPVVSSLARDTVYSLTPAISAAIERHFADVQPLRASLANSLRGAFGDVRRVPDLQLRSLDAAAAFAQGLDAYEQQEYTRAFEGFDAATRLDTRGAIPLAWRARTARIIRKDDEAAESAERAVMMISERTPLRQRLFVEATAAEIRRDVPTATVRFRTMARAARDSPAWLMELAAFEDRQNLNAEALADYLAALNLDNGLTRAHLDLCRIYNRLQESVKAREHAELALTAYQRVGDRANEAQVLMCRADARRTGTDDDRVAARADAERAIALFTDLGLLYNTARAYNYAAMVSGMQGLRADAAAFGEQALDAARRSGNLPLQPLVLMNLGVTSEALGRRAKSADYYAESAAIYEKFGDQTRAAEIQANRAALLVEYADDPSGALRDLQNALAVFRKLGNKNFEVMAAQVAAAFDRYAGRFPAAEAALNRALAIARERSLVDDVASLTIDLARTRSDAGDPAAARTLLIAAIGDGRGPNAPAARIHLARVETRLGQLPAAAEALRSAVAEITERHVDGLLPLLYLAQGEFATASGDSGAARSNFEKSSQLWVDDFADDASIEARAFLGALENRAGRQTIGRRAIVEAIDKAHRKARTVLEARCRDLLTHGTT